MKLKLDDDLKRRFLDGELDHGEAAIAHLLRRSNKMEEAIGLQQQTIDQLANGARREAKKKDRFGWLEIE